MTMLNAVNPLPQKGKYESPSVEKVYFVTGKALLQTSTTLLGGENPFDELFPGF